MRRPSRWPRELLIERAVKKMAQLDTIEQLLAFVVHLTTYHFESSRCALFVRDRSSQFYSLQAQRGYPSHFHAPSFSSEDDLVKTAVAKRTLIDHEHIQAMIQERKEALREEAVLNFSDLYHLQSVLDVMHAHVCIPAQLGDDVSAFLFVGWRDERVVDKREFTRHLVRLMKQVAITIEDVWVKEAIRDRYRRLKELDIRLEDTYERLRFALNEVEEQQERLTTVQQQLAEDQRLVSVARLAGSLGHEIGNPLTLLSVNLGRAEKLVASGSSVESEGEVQGIFRKLKQAVSRIQAVVSTLTGLLRRTELGHLEQLDLGRLIDDTVPLIEFQSSVKNFQEVRVEIEIPDDLPSIHGDGERLQEVLLNLFTNAYHALEQTSQPVIRVECGEDPIEKRVVLRVSDNGCGIAHECLPKVFDYRFTTKRPGKGMGLGLYIAKYILELYGGSMKAESPRVSSRAFDGEAMDLSGVAEPGSTFTLILPVEVPKMVGVGSGSLEANSSTD